MLHKNLILLLLPLSWIFIFFKLLFVFASFSTNFIERVHFFCCLFIFDFFSSFFSHLLLDKSVKYGCQDKIYCVSFFLIAFFFLQHFLFVDAFNRALDFPFEFSFLGIFFNSVSEASGRVGWLVELFKFFFLFEFPF